MNRRKRTLLFLVESVLAAMGFAMFAKEKYARVISPDGGFIAVAESPRYEAWFSRGPGASGDKSGTITLLTREGAKVGTVRVPMVSFVQDIRWTEDEAQIPGLVNWQITAE